MKQAHAEDIYVCFQKFSDEFILKGNSILSNDKGVLSLQTINNCFKYYVDNFKKGSEGFAVKVEEQFKDADINTKLVFAHALWLWSFAVDDITVDTKKSQIQDTTGKNVDDLSTDVYPVGFGSAGTYHKNNKYGEVKFNLILIRFLKEKVDAGEIKTIEQVYDWTEKFCLIQKYDQEFPDFPISEELYNELPKQKLAMCNILCHVAFPDRYERIASDNHKWRVFDSFSGLLSEKEKKDESKNTDEKILLIRKILAGIVNNSDFDFYDDDYKIVWNYSSTQDNFSEIQGLHYKKAIILYGPPGTSKTYSAKNLAYALIVKKYLSKKENVIKYFKDEEDFTNGRIHHLQLHQNYNYEDFVAGMQLENHTIKAVKGKLFDICDEARKDKEEAIPHILILDEINRIDLSKLFGEVFSALENREEEIEIGLGNLKLSIPDNLYVIGTMNEIDFSIERIDFALRRRFLWFFYGFDKPTLTDIIWQKDRKLNTRLDEDEVNVFADNAEALNNAIIMLPELGNKYQVGHTFFAEIVNIFNSYKELKGYTNKLKTQIYRKDGPAKILWDISIEPILSAFLGNMDEDSKKEKLNELQSVFLNGK